MTSARPVGVDTVDPDALAELWIAVVRAGGSVGFVQDSPAADIRAAARTTASDVDAGTLHAVVVSAPPDGSSGAAEAALIRGPRLGRPTGRSPSARPGPVSRPGSGLDGVIFLRPGAKPIVAHRADVVRLMVHPDRQGSGLGRALLEAAVVRAGELGLEQLLLSARGGTGTPEFYRHCGWTPVGVWPQVLRVGPGDDRDEHWFHRAVPPAAGASHRSSRPGAPHRPPHTDADGHLCDITASPDVSALRRVRPRTDPVADGHLRRLPPSVPWCDGRG